MAMAAPAPMLKALGEVQETDAHKDPKCAMMSTLFADILQMVCKEACGWHSETPGHINPEICPCPVCDPYRDGSYWGYDRSLFFGPNDEPESSSSPPPPPTSMGTFTAEGGEYECKETYGVSGQNDIIFKKGVPSQAECAHECDRQESCTAFEFKSSNGQCQISFTATIAQGKSSGMAGWTFCEQVAPASSTCDC